MIIEWLMWLGVNVFGMTMEQMPRFDDVEGVVLTASGYLLPLASGLASLGAWIPWGVLGVCMPIVIGTYIICLVIRLARAVVAHVPFVGGAG